MMCYKPRSKTGKMPRKWGNAQKMGQYPENGAMPRKWGNAQKMGQSPEIGAKCT